MPEKDAGNLTRREFLKDTAIAAGVLTLGIHAMPQEEAMAAEKSEKLIDKILPGGKNPLAASDPEFAERFDHFAFEEAALFGGIDDKTRVMAILATLLGCQGADAFRLMLAGALDCGLTPVEAREIVYQAVAYLGFGRVYPFFNILNEALRARGIALPLEKQATTTLGDRREKGNQTQIDIFGERMREFWKTGPEDTSHIRAWLAANCFGDYYTRKGLDLRQRELITFCYILAQGGCESQLASHCQGNMRMGNSKEFLIAIVSQIVPYIGYPRSLNAIACIEKAAGDMAKK